MPLQCGVCPSCFSYRLQHGKILFDADTQTILRLFTCKKCKLKGAEEYKVKFTGFSI